MGRVFDDISGGAVRRVCVTQARVVPVVCPLDQSRAFALTLFSWILLQEAAGVSVE